MRSKRNFTIILFIVAIGILLAYFFSHNKNTLSQHMGKDEIAQSVNTNSVTIKNYAYSPKKITVKKGTTVTWENTDLIPHTVTEVNKSKNGPGSENFGKGEKYSFTFKEIGVYDYYCKPHPFMKATVEVTD